MAKKKSNLDRIEEELAKRKIVDFPRGRTPIAKTDEMGQLVEDFTTEKSHVFGRTAKGESFYEEEGTKYLDFRDHDNHQTRIEVNRSVLGPVVNDFINYLKAKGKVDLKKLESSDVVFLEGDLPGVKKEGKTKVYSGRCEDIYVETPDGKKVKKQLVIVDKRLTDKEKIATLYHELVHARGEVDEGKTQTETIYGLREMLKSYKDVLADEEQEKYFGSQHDPDILEDEGHEPVKIRGAVNYALSCRQSLDVDYNELKKKLRKSKRAGSTGKLEKMVTIAFLFFLFVFVISGVPIFTGAVTYTNSKITLLNDITFFFLMGLVLIKIYLGLRLE